MLLSILILDGFKAFRHQVSGKVKVQVKFTREQATKALISELDGGGWSTLRTGRITSGKDPLPIVQEAGWAPGPVWTGAENLASPELDPRTVQPVASRYTDWAIVAPSGICRHNFSALKRS
jgi:hypothetical protein